MLHVSGCSEYNFCHIFPFDKNLHKRARKLDKIQGYECIVSRQEYDSLQSTIAHSYPVWKKLEKGCCFHSNGVAIGNNFFGDTTSLVFYAVGKNFEIGGDRLPIIIILFREAKDAFLYCGGWNALMAICPDTSFPKAIPRPGRNFSNGIDGYRSGADQLDFRRKNRKIFL